MCVKWSGLSVMCGLLVFTGSALSNAETLPPLLDGAQAKRAEQFFKTPAFGKPLPTALGRHSQNKLLSKLRDWAAIQEKSGADIPLASLTKSAAQMRDFPRWSTTQRRVESALSLTDPAQTILAWFAVAEPITSRGRILHADALVRSGLDTPDQTQAIQTAWRTAWLDYEDEDIILGRHSARLTPADHIARARYMMAFEGYSSARRMVRRLPRNERLLLRARLALRSFEAGVDGAIAAVPAQFKNDASLILDRAYWRRQKGKADGAIALLTPDVDAMALLRPERLWRERHFWARRRLREGAYEAAYALSAQHQMRIPTDATSARIRKIRIAYAEAEWTAGWIALRFLKMPERAAAHFKTMYDNVATPVSRTRGAYWLGRASAALGDIEDARQWYAKAAIYPQRYYGRLAAENLSSPPKPITLNVAMAAPKAADEQYKTFLKRPQVRAARLLKDVGRDDLVGIFLSDLARQQSSPADVYLMARFGAELGRPDLPLTIAKMLEAKGIVYDDAGYPTIKLPQRLRGQAALIHAIARQESAFNPTVVSRAGARGLMQLMPATARRVARENNMRYRFEKLTQDPAYNMALSSHYLTFLSEEFTGAEPLMIAAYNAGENAVARWLKTYGDPYAAEIDAIDWMEFIPYSETRNYVQRVLEALVIYQDRFESGTRRPLHALVSGKDPADG